MQHENRSKYKIRKLRRIIQKNTGTNPYPYTQAKLIYLIRNPIERTISHWRHFKGRSANDKVADFHELLDDQYLLEKIVQCSMYFEQINKFRQYFPDDQIHCITFEDLTEKPLKTLRALFKFAKIKGNPKNLLKTENGSAKLPQKNQAGAKKRIFVEAPELSNEFKTRLENHFKDDSEKFLNYIGKSAYYWN